MSFAEGIGGVGMWGFSPAIDLQEIYCQLFDKDGASEKDALSFLVVGANDPRHLVLTIARRIRHSNRALNFYVVERNAEQLARHIVLLSILWDQQLTASEACDCYLEVFGNAKLRLRTAEYLGATARALLAALAKEQPLLHGMLSLELLRNRQRDEVEDALRSLYVSVPFEIDKLWEARLRRYYTDRYDYRNNMIDWDLHMKLEPRGASIVHSLLYRNWRNTGVAFEVRQSTYTEPNRSLASYAEGTERGQLMRKRGYWGDIVASPYIAWGIEAEDPTLFKKASMQHRHHCQDVAEFNVRACLHEMASGTRYKRPTPIDDDPFGEPPSEEAEAEAEVEADGEERRPMRSVAPPEGVQVYLVLGQVADLLGKRRYANLFDVVSFSAPSISQVSEQARELLSSRAAVSFETAKFMLDLNKEQIKAFGARLPKTAATLGCRPVHADTAAAADEDSGLLLAARTFAWDAADPAPPPAVREAAAAAPPPATADSDALHEVALESAGADDGLRPPVEAEALGALGGDGVVSLAAPAKAVAAAATAAVVRVCSLCDSGQAPKYTCPKCKALYCSVGCYKAHGTSCTSTFYSKQEDESALKRVLEEENKTKAPSPFDIRRGVDYMRTGSENVVPQQRA